MLLTRMRAQRLARGVTLSAVAKAVGLSESFVGHLEHNRMKASDKVAARIARYFDTRVDRLFDPVVLVVKNAR